MTKIYKRKKSNREPYFTMDTQKSIILYNNETDTRIKNKIFKENIYYSIDKLVEFNLRCYSWDYIFLFLDYEDIKSELVAHIVEKLGSYKEENGNAFSYFNRTAKNFLITKNQSYYKQNNRKVEVEQIDYSRDIDNEVIRENTQDTLFIFFNMFLEKIENNLLSLFPTKSDLMVADAIIHILKNREMLEYYNKKTIYIMVNNMTNAKSNNIVSVLRTIREKYFEYREIYDKNQTLEVSGSFW